MLFLVMVVCVGHRNIAKSKKKGKEHKPRNATLHLILGLQSPQERRLLFERLERTMTKLGARIDELELNLLQVSAARVDHEGFADGDDALLGARDGPLEHDEVVLDDAVVGEPAHGGDRFFGRVGFGGGVVGVGAGADAVDFFVELCAVVVAVWSAGVGKWVYFV